MFFFLRTRPPPVTTRPDTLFPYTALFRSRNRQNSIMTRLESATNRVRMREVYAGPKTQDAFSRFDVLERRVAMAEGRADALSLGAPQKTLDEEIAELRSSEKVEADLAALQDQMNKEDSADGGFFDLDGDRKCERSGMSVS